MKGKRKHVPALTLFELFEYLPFCLRLGLYLLLPCLLARATARLKDPEWNEERGRARVVGMTCLQIAR
jgi:hypothetical protein